MQAMMEKFLRCSSVLQVFQATIAWVRHEYPERRKYVYKLLRQVHLAMMMVMMVTSYSGTCTFPHHLHHPHHPQHDHQARAPASHLPRFPDDHGGQRAAGQGEPGLQGVDAGGQSGRCHSIYLFVVCEPKFKTLTKLVLDVRDAAYMQKAGDSWDISPQIFLDFPQNFRLRTRSQYCTQAIA